MPHRIEIALKRGQRDAVGARVSAEITSYLGFSVEKVRTIDVYTVDAELNAEELTRLAEAYCDPIIHDFAVDAPLARGFEWLIEIGFRPGVTDNVGRTSTEAARLVLGDAFPKGSLVYTSRQYLISGELVRSEAEAIARGLLCNTLIHRFHAVDRRSFEEMGGMPAEVPRVAALADPVVETVDLERDDDALTALSRERTLALTLEEMRAIRDYYRRPEVQEARRARGLPVAPTDVEVEVFAQTWSEHCKHKIFSARVSYVEDSKPAEEIDSIFKSYIQHATKIVRENLGENDFCLSVFKDNAGVWKFTDETSLVFKVETHNSPSALDPYGGALTGIVGVNRDPLGTGQGARLFCNTDVFCLADPFYAGEIPQRLLHPRRVMEGVREGVEHGGNKSGVPTVNGSLAFDERFLGKPLVFCGTGGIMPAQVNGAPSHEKGAHPGDRVVMIGGRIGKDGIHGATFSSEELHEGSPATAVQIGDPITQKRMLDFLLRARDEGLMTCLTDNGAGGLSSSIGEMAEGPGGARVELSKAPLKYAGLRPWEIFVSEAQERMTAAVAPEKIDRFMSLSREMGVESTDLGVFTEKPYLELEYDGAPAALLDMEFLHGGLPQLVIEARWKSADESMPLVPKAGDLGALLIAMLSRLDICSKERWVRQYDHEVQGGSVVKPLVGASHDGPSDGAVVRPVLESMRAVSVSHGLCPRYSDIDSRDMAMCAFDEAVRGSVAVGANPELLVALDNFCWCDPVQSKANPDGRVKMAKLVRAAKALHDVCIEYGVPLVSGKDSMKNDYAIGTTRISIPPTLLVTVVGQLEDARKAVTMDAKHPGDAVFVVGTTHADLGATQYFDHLGMKGGPVPKLRDPAATAEMYGWLHRAIEGGLVASCHDVSDGGLGVAFAETAFAGGLGMTVDLDKVPRSEVDRDDVLLFSETPGRFVVTTKATAARAFEILMGGKAVRVGCVSEDPRLRIEGLYGETAVDADVFDLKAAWQRPLAPEEVR